MNALIYSSLSHASMAASVSQTGTEAGRAESLTMTVPANPPAFAEEVQRFFDTMSGVFSKGDALAQPEHLLSHLQTLGAVWAVVFLVVGITCMFNGYKFYKIATIGLALLLGMFLGFAFGQKLGAPYVFAGCIGVLMAVIAFPLMKYAVALFGGLAGAFTGANLWSGCADAINKLTASGEAGVEAMIPPDAFWIGALLGLLICGMLAFILFKLSIVMFTSVSGSTIAVMGALTLLLGVDGWRDTLIEALTSNQLVIPLLVFVPAAIGFIRQETTSGGFSEGEGKPAAA